MKYKELKDRLEDLSENQLNQEVVFIREEESFVIDRIEILEKPLYYDPDNTEDGCFELELGQDSDPYNIAYDFGYPLLTD